MRHLKEILLFLLLVYLPEAVLSAEGYSSSEPSMPANIYQRAFTIHTGEKACKESPEIASIKLQLPRKTMHIGDRLHTNTLDNSIASDLIIEAFDAAGNFVPSVPVYVSAHSIGRTKDFDPGIIYRDGSMEYWEIKKLGKFEVLVRWHCNYSRNASVFDRVNVEVIEGKKNL